MSGYPPGVAITNWGDYIQEAHREEAAAFWDQVYRSDEPTQSTEWQFLNGRWGEYLILRQIKADNGHSVSVSAIYV